mmetsp:Transcript_64695/g.134083  ORF Transcript_64695/g.134083 Transcript_64695/m.134083 type:complete len:108 (-) Transcript_64695:470-793(-)
MAEVLAAPICSARLDTKSVSLSVGFQSAAHVLGPAGQNVFVSDSIPPWRARNCEKRRSTREHSSTLSTVFLPLQGSQDLLQASPVSELHPIAAEQAHFVYRPEPCSI